MKELLNPWVILAAVLTLVATAATGYHYGSKHTRNELEKEKNEAIIKAVDDANVQSKADHELNMLEAEKVHLAKLQEARRNVKVIREINNNTVYRNGDCAIPDSGLLLIRDAARGKGDEVPTGTSDGEATGTTP